MDSIAKREYLVLVGCSILLLSFIFPSLLHARRETRDGIQREAVAQKKRSLEDVNNKLGYYPVSFSAAPFSYYVTMKEGDKALGWYIAGPIENPQKSGSFYDAEEGHNFFYRYVKENGKTLYEICGGELQC